MENGQKHGGVLQASQKHVAFCFEVLAGHYSGAGAPRPSFDDVHWCVIELFGNVTVCPADCRAHLSACGASARAVRCS